MEFNTQDIIGQRFGFLVVSEYAGTTKVGKYQAIRYNYRCICDCGNNKVLSRTNLITYHTKSCGCQKLRTTNKNPTWNGYGEISGRLWSSIVNKSISRKLELAITIKDAWEQFIKQDGKCALTGEKLSLRSVRGAYSLKTASLDRIDNTKGYTKDNIQWIHKDVNWMKGRYKESYFISICEKVTNFKKGQI